jgi:hypothetical protein
MKTELQNEKEIAEKYEDRYFSALLIIKEIVKQYDSAPDGVLGMGFTNKPFLCAREFLDCTGGRV